MPLSDIDWTASGRDPFAFLVQWAAAAADALNKPLLENGSLFTAQVRCQARAGILPRLADAPAATHVAPARFTDRVWVNLTDGINPEPAAAVLFVTPDNKVDSDGSLAFAVRAASLVSAGVGVVIVDILPGPPSWATHLHSLTGVYPITRRPRSGEAPILVVHPEAADGAERYAVWHHLVAAGFPLPTVPVPVRGAMHLKLDLEATYAEACRNGRIS